MDRKRIAALTGVIYYLRDEESRKEQENTRKIPGGNTGPWVLCGRQMIMSGRALIQRRDFARSGSRAVVNASVSGRIGRISKIRVLTGNLIRNMIRSRSF